MLFQYTVLEARHSDQCVERVMPLPKVLEGILPCCFPALVDEAAQYSLATMLTSSVSLSSQCLWSAHLHPLGPLLWYIEALVSK